MDEVVEVVYGLEEESQSQNGESQYEERSDIDE